MFEALQTALMFSWGRGNSKLAFVDDIQQVVQSQCKRTLSNSRLRQLLLLAPEVLQVQYSLRSGRDSTQQQCLAFLQPEGVQDMLHSSTLRRNSVMRVKTRIVAFLKQEHQKFLSAKGLGTNVFQDSWHPEFLRQHPTLPQAVLPDAPKVSKTSLLSQVQKKHDEIMKCAASQANTNEDESSDQPTSLLERIQQKEKVHMATINLLGNAETRSERQQLEKLPELSSTLRHHFKIEKRQSMKLEKLVEELLKQSRWGSTAQEIESLLSKLAELVPEWCSLQKIGKIQVFKILNMDANLSTEVHPKLSHLA
eukprot:TRINITY_DN10290_c0_g1_i2.p1 TRINITY_DN10290_c0_g1~~TRINITY_DN10290_c0_g1_i2.p1  ORF type:complete len:309 (-),score=70.49 TRINITY_DN10290_c0_g1_i2:90-1016(-)